MTLRLTRHQSIIQTADTHAIHVSSYHTLHPSIYTHCRLQTLPTETDFPILTLFLRWHSVGIALASIGEQMKKIKPVRSQAAVGFPAFSPCRWGLPNSPPTPRNFFWVGIALASIGEQMKCYEKIQGENRKLNSRKQNRIKLLF